MNNFLKDIKLQPSDYESAAYLAKEVGEELVTRLDLMQLAPKLILDLGCGVSETGVLLQKRFALASTIGIDISQSMLACNKTHHNLICADVLHLPLRNESVEMIVANFLVSFLYAQENNLAALFQECKRVLKPNGIIMITGLGIDSLKNLPQEFASQLPKTFDMHDVGDELMRQGFSDPVLDVSHYSVRYQSYEKLLQELYMSEMISNVNDLDSLPELAPAADGCWHLEFEVIFAHAFVPSFTPTAKPSADGTVSIPVSHLQKIRK